MIEIQTVVSSPEIYQKSSKYLEYHHHRLMHKQYYRAQLTGFWYLLGGFGYALESDKEL